MNELNPTKEIYNTLQDAYDFFNRNLFEAKLPGCIITMQRKGKARGYFCAERFETRQGETYKVHEIALNPALFRERTDRDILSTLVHEMVHLWHEEKGTAPRRAYHNGEWADKMEDLGLMPSNTEEEGGERTGHSMSHYILPDGRFDTMCEVFLDEGKKTVSYQDRPEPEKKKAKKNKIKYSCPECHQNVWAKPAANILCGIDEVKMLAQELPE